VRLRNSPLVILVVQEGMQVVRWFLRLAWGCGFYLNGFPRCDATHVNQTDGPLEA
jgi:hypothetical protein